MISDVDKADIMTAPRTPTPYPLTIKCKNPSLHSHRSPIQQAHDCTTRLHHTHPSLHSHRSPIQQAHNCTTRTRPYQLLKSVCDCFLIGQILYQINRVVCKSGVQEWCTVHVCHSAYGIRARGQNSHGSHLSFTPSHGCSTPSALGWPAGPRTHG